MAAGFTRAAERNQRKWEWGRNHRLSVTIFACLGRHCKYHRNASSRFRRLTAPDQGVSRAGFFRGLRGESVPCLPTGFWCFAGNLWGSLPHRPITSPLPSCSPRAPLYVCLCVHSPHLYKDTSPTGLEPTLTTFSLPDLVCKDPISKERHYVLWNLGLSLHHTFMFLGGDTNEPLRVPQSWQ